MEPFDSLQEKHLIRQPFESLQEKHIITNYFPCLVWFGLVWFGLVWGVLTPRTFVVLGAMVYCTTI